MMYSQKVAIPSGSMILLSKEESLAKGDADFTIVKYVDSLICSSCTLDATHKWIDSLYSLPNTQRLGYSIIFSPKKKSVQDFCTLYYESELKASINVDTCQAFMTNNKQIPNNSVCHVFLIDKANNVRLIGDPVYHPKVRKLFEEILCKGSRTEEKQ